MKKNENVMTHVDRRDAIKSMALAVIGLISSKKEIGSAIQLPRVRVYPDSADMRYVSVVLDDNSELFVLGTKTQDCQPNEINSIFWRSSGLGRWMLIEIDNHTRLVSVIDSENNILAISYLSDALALINLTGPGFTDLSPFFISRSIDAMSSQVKVNNSTTTNTSITSVLDDECWTGGNKGRISARCEDGTSAPLGTKVGIRATAVKENPTFITNIPVGKCPGENNSGDHYYAVDSILSTSCNLIDSRVIIDFVKARACSWVFDWPFKAICLNAPPALGKAVCALIAEITRVLDYRGELCARLAVATNNIIIGEAPKELLLLPWAETPGCRGRIYGPPQTLDLRTKGNIPSFIITVPCSCEAPILWRSKNAYSWVYVDDDIDMYNHSELESAWYEHGTRNKHIIRKVKGFPDTYWDGLAYGQMATTSSNGNGNCFINAYARIERDNHEGTGNRFVQVTAITQITLDLFVPKPLASKYIYRADIEADIDRTNDVPFFYKSWVQSRYMNYIYEDSVSQNKEFLTKGSNIVEKINNVEYTLIESLNVLTHVRASSQPSDNLQAAHTNVGLKLQLSFMRRS